MKLKSQDVSDFVSKKENQHWDTICVLGKVSSKQAFTLPLEQRYCLDSKHFQ